MNLLDLWFRQKTCVSKPYTVGALYYLLCLLNSYNTVSKWETQNFIESKNDDKIIIYMWNQL